VKPRFAGAAGVWHPLVLTLTVAAHALAIMGWAAHGVDSAAPRPEPPPAIVWLDLTPPRPVETPLPPPAPRPAADVPRPPVPTLPAWEPQVPRTVAVDRAPATRAAPAAPTAAQWAFASGYTLKNAKAYRHTWGQQIRSQMGTAVEGPDQGMVRFRVEIAPDGSLARLETLWSTSAVAERLARQAVEALPRWAPTPGGQPLVFERTITFSAFANDDPPIYKDDCLPDPPVFRNPFAWDGGLVREITRPPPAKPPDPQALEDCLKQLPQDSLEAEAAHDRRQIERWWGSGQPLR
jgi:TonB family protein